MIDQPTVAWLNGMTIDEARAVFLRCCGAARWAEAMVAARPFADGAALLAESSRAFDALDRSDWLQAFASHPKIGDPDSLRKKYAHNGAWSAQEQSGVAGALEDTIQRLARGNAEYEGRHGFIFIVCATGKSAAEMLDLLEARVHNATDAEVANAAVEQRKITTLRLEKLTP